MIEVRAGTDADKPGILELLSAVFGAEHAHLVDRCWDWQWRLDPRLPEPGYRGTVAVAGDRVIGSVGFMPAALHTFGKPLRAVWGIDASVHAGWVRQALKQERAARAAGSVAGRRRRSVSADLLNHPSAGPMILGKLVSDQMRVVLLKIGFQEVAESGYSARNLSLTPRIARVTGGLLAPVLALAPNLILGRVARPPATVSVHTGEFGAEFDDLWRRNCSEFPCIGLRSSAVLNWRYRRHPLNTYTTIVDRKNGELRGYAVVSAFAKRRCLRGRIVDLFTGHGRLEQAHGLLAGALRELRRQGADRVDCYLADKTLSSVLRSLRMTPRRSVQPLLVRWSGNEIPIHVMAGDGDGG
jgi:hypothetical protein